MAASVMFAFTIPNSVQADEMASTHPFAATGFIAGGGAWTNNPYECCDIEIGKIVGGGDFVIPATADWNIQLGGAGHYEWHYDVQDDATGTLFQTQANAIAYYRNHTLGTLGFELGVFDPDRQSVYTKLGGIAEYYFGESATILAFGGFLLPHDDTISPFVTAENGYYAGGRVTTYLNDRYALSGEVLYLEENQDFDFVNANAGSLQESALRVTGEFRYLTSLSGTEVFLAGGYTRCESQTTIARGAGTNSTDVSDGAMVMGGIRIHLGGVQGSLVSIDRSNAIDTRAWQCQIFND